jgi:hypothetical protein
MQTTINPISLIETHFGNLRDSRAEHKILIITICSLPCGVDNFVVVAEYGKDKEKWLKTFLELENCIPSVNIVTA